MFASQRTAFSTKTTPQATHGLGLLQREKAEEAGTSVTESHSGVQLVHKVFQGNAEILAVSRPDQRTGETGTAEGCLPPTDGQVRPDWKEHRSSESRVTWSFRLLSSVNVYL